MAYWDGVGLEVPIWYLAQGVLVIWAGSSLKTYYENIIYGQGKKYQESIASLYPGQ